jgi:hypothetical protein
MPNFPNLKKVASILLSCSFLVNCVMMPFCNFQDIASAKTLYDSFLQKDGDGDVFEFITNDMLNMGGLFEDEDDDEPEDQAPQQQQQRPLQPIQITQGFLYCAQAMLLEEKEPAFTPRVFGSFVNNTYKFELPISIFHPPAVTA